MNGDKYVYEVFCLLIADVLLKTLIILCVLLSRLELRHWRPLVLIGNFELNVQTVFSLFCYISVPYLLADA